jgi:prepilin-type N-terminal cleavage/methylation domain-containing protein
MKRRSRGFTLMELMVVLAIAATVLVIGVPNFRDFQRNNRITAAANSMLGLVLSSRGEALRRQTSIAMCPSANPTSVTAVCGTGTGWISFVDTNATCTRTASQDLVGSSTVDTDVNVAWNGDCIIFSSTGFRIVNPGKPAIEHMMFCDSRKNTPRTPKATESAARGIEILPTGRAAVVKFVDELTTWNSGTDKVSCP